MEQPTFKGSKVTGSEWMDNVTFMVWFEPRKGEITDSDGKKVKVEYNPFAEVHLDEDNKVVLGENIFSLDGNGNVIDYVGTNYYNVAERKMVDEDGFDLDNPYDLENGEDIMRYAVEDMKTTM